MMPGRLVQVISKSISGRSEKELDVGICMGVMYYEGSDKIQMVQVLGKTGRVISYNLGYIHEDTVWEVRYV